MTHDQLERRVRFLTHYAVGTTLVLLVFSLGAFGYATTRFDVIDVERINVVEPDGRVSLVISNAARIPGPIFGGKELPKEMSVGRVGSSGIVFYNAEGTESGGLITRTAASDSGYAATGMLAFDQYNQDQAVQITYSDSDGEAFAGMVVNDHPSTPLADLVAAYQTMQSGTEAEKAGAQSLFESLDIAPHTQRVFVGKEGDVSLLLLHDQRGHARIRMMVSADGQAYLDFLGDDGSILHRLPE